MPILVDTNVILDLVTDDPVWAEWSSKMLEKHAADGLLINAIVFSELCSNSTSLREVNDLVGRMNLKWEDIPRTALFAAAQAFVSYRKRGGAKTSTLPDFFIGAHAQALNVPILTRDRTKFTSYVPNVALLAPEENP